MVNITEITTSLSRLPNFDQTSENQQGFNAHDDALNWCNSCEASMRVFFLKDIENEEVSSMMIYLQGYDSGYIAHLGGGQERAESRTVTVDEVVTEGIMIQIPTKTRSQERTFVRLCEDLVNLFVEKPSASETQVCSVIKSALVSIVDRGGLIDENKMLGLTGELCLLNEMLQIARNTD